MSRRRLIYQLNLARHSLMKYLDAGCREQLGVSVVQLTALMVIGELKSCQMKDLAAQLLLDKSAVTGMAKRLLKQNLIIKSASLRDGRASLLSLSAEGTQILQHGLALLSQANQMIHADFSEQELDTVSRFLNHLTNTFQPRSQS